MQEPANETPKGNEVKDPYVQYELVADPNRLRQLVDNTLTDVVIQTLSSANGRAELASTDHPRFEAKRQENANLAHEAVQLSIKQVKELQEILRNKHNQIPVDTRYGDKTKDFIRLPSARKDSLPPLAPPKPTAPTK